MITRGASPLFSKSIDRTILGLHWTSGVAPSLPRRPEAKRIYIDLNHWIGLSKARLGQPEDGPYSGALEALTDGVKSGRLMLPLSAAHYEEVSAIADPRQRADIALTMDRLSRYVAIADRAVLLRYQLLAALCDWRGVECPPIHSTGVWGRGNAFAFGFDPGGMAVHGPEALRRRFLRDPALLRRIEKAAGSGWTFAEEMRLGEEAAARALWESSEFAVLRGPSDSDVPGLRSHGYAPENFRASVDAITKREADLTRILREEGKTQLDDIVAARLWIWELNEPLAWAAAQLGIDPNVVFDAGKKVVTQLLLAMPTMAVEFALRRANWANGDYKWTKNDIYDLAALGVAVPYCDVTWTEKHAASVLNRAHVPAKLGKVVVATPQDLLGHVRSLE